MKRRDCLALMGASSLLLAGCAGVPAATGTGDLGVVVARSTGTLAIVNTSQRTLLAEVKGLGDLSHASVVFSRDGRYAFVFGRDGALTKVDLLTHRIAGRVMQAGNSIGGAISADGRLVVAQNYTPGGIKAFDTTTLELVADIPAEYENGKLSRVVGLVDLPGAASPTACSTPTPSGSPTCPTPHAPLPPSCPTLASSPMTRWSRPMAATTSPGLFGEDGLAMVDLWEDKPTVRRILGGYGRGQEPLPVYKMPHLRGWAVAGRRAYLPAIGRHEVLVVDTDTWQEVGRIPVAGQPVFVMARPDGRQVWVNFSVPDYHRVQVIDTTTQRSCARWSPARPCCTWSSRRAASRSGSARATTTASA
jgi:protein NirF